MYKRQICMSSIDSAEIETPSAERRLCRVKSCTVISMYANTITATIARANTVYAVFFFMLCVPC